MTTRLCALVLSLVRVLASGACKEGQANCITGSIADKAEEIRTSLLQKDFRLRSAVSPDKTPAVYVYDLVGLGSCLDSQHNHGTVYYTSVDSSNLDNCKSLCDGEPTCTGFDDRADGCHWYSGLVIVAGNDWQDAHCYRKVQAHYQYEFVGNGPCADQKHDYSTFFGSVYDTPVDAGSLENCQGVCNHLPTCVGFDTRTTGCRLYGGSVITSYDDTTELSNVSCYRKIQASHEYALIGTGACLDAERKNGTIYDTEVDASRLSNCMELCNTLDSCAGFDTRASGCLLYSGLVITTSDARQGIQCYRKIEATHEPLGFSAEHAVIAEDSMSSMKPT